ALFLTISIVLAITFILLSITGIQMASYVHVPGIDSQYLTEQGQQNSSYEEQFGEHFYPSIVHEWGGYIFIIAGLIHIGLNLKPMKSYLCFSSKPGRVNKIGY
uniref:DUF4405 domain-containing protein n=1 Tax=Pectinatus frisingensis TaxID=865 RepID=UPI0018C4C3A0